MAADEFRCRMEDDIAAVFKGTEEIRCSEGIIYENGDTVFMSDFGNGFKIRNVDGRVAQAFEVHGFRLVRNGGSKGLRVIGIGEFYGNAQVFERIAEQFNRATVERRSGNDFITGTSQVDQRKGNSSGACSCGQRSCTAFESGNAFFQDIPRRVSQTGIDEARFFQGELVFAILRVVKYIARRLVNRYGTCACRRIGYLACMLL